MQLIADCRISRGSSKIRVCVVSENDGVSRLSIIEHASNQRMRTLTVEYSESAISVKCRTYKEGRFGYGVYRECNPRLRMFNYALLLEAEKADPVLVEIFSKLIQRLSQNEPTG